MGVDDPPGPDSEDDEVAPVIAETVTGQAAPAAKLDTPAGGSAKPERPRLELAREPLYRESRGYRMRLEPADLARLRELPGSKGRSDEELGEAFFDGQSDRFTTALAEDVPAPAEIRVVVDPYSRQAFLALENKIRAILSF
jgi:hypothetical protein